MPRNRAAQLLRRLLPDSYARQVGVLAGGAAASQAINVLSIPILTRLFSPDAFSILAMYIAALGILSTVACGRLEIAIPIAKSHRQSNGLLALSIIFCTVLAILTGIVCLTMNLFGQPAFFGRWPISIQIMLVFGVWLTGLFTAFQYWLTRSQEFGSITRNRFLQSSAITGSQLGIGLFQATGTTLVAGNLIGLLAGVINIALSLPATLFHSMRRSSMMQLLATLRRFKRFPKYSLPESLFNSAGYQAPIFLIGALAAAPESGYLMLAMKAMQIPMALIGTAVSQVYLSSAREQNEQGRLNELTKKTLTGLAKAGAGPLLFAGIVAPQLAAVVLGKQWERTGDLIMWMAPWFVLQFLASPISMVMHVKNRQPLVLGISAGGFILRVMPLLAAYHFAPTKMPEIYAISSAIFYLICLVVFAKIATLDNRQIVQCLTSNKKIIGIWVLSGAALSIIIQIYYR